MTPSTLRLWREARGWSRRQAGERLGLPLRTIESLEQGKAPTSSLWGLLARVTALLDQLRDAGDEP